MGNKGKSIELAQLFSEKIRSGEWKDGEKLRPIHKLAEEYRTAVATISKTLEILEKDEMVERVNGRGVFVRGKKKIRVAIVFDSVAEQGAYAHKSSFMHIFREKCLVQDVVFTVFENVDRASDCMLVRKHLTENIYDAILVSSGYFAIHQEKYLKNIPILVIGCYAYKWINFYMKFQNWLEDAVTYLLDHGCDKIALIDHEGEAADWLHPREISVADIYQNMLRKDPEHFSQQLYKQAARSPRGGYIATRELFSENLDCKRLGIISFDDIFTSGVISAIFQSEKKLWEDVFLATHGNEGSNLSEHPVPLITYRANITAECNSIIDTVKEYVKTKKQPVGAIVCPVEFYSPLD